MDEGLRQASPRVVTGANWLRGGTEWGQGRRKHEAMMPTLCHPELSETLYGLHTYPHQLWSSRAHCVFGRKEANRHNQLGIKLNFD